MLITLAGSAPLPQSPWGGLLAAYFTLVGIPSGLTMATLWHRDRFGATSTVLDWRSTWICLVVLGLAGLLLTVDLGRPERFFLMLTRFGNWDSPISLGAKIIAVKMLLLVVALYLLWRRRGGAVDAGVEPARGATFVLDRGTAWLLGATSFALAVYPVAVLARTWVSPLANTSGSALLYLITSLLMGAAIVQALHIFDDQATEQQLAAHGRATLALLGAYAVTMVFSAISVSNGPAERALTSLLAGEWAPLFYAGVLGLGVVVPVVILIAAGRGRAGRAVAAVAILTGAATLRYLIFAV
ncbi:NrfD/PsrC family molybdoenzyme membrane anchor subunit [Actinokineospora fastidiosa]|uniref:Polysulfide reductase n=1 Tax=Actinokineospora fastidiosa TaxID=1816 RepID=A0A918GC09_9PSEU|nr:NrfD/PsrC family molybdoenzyme membrane anchor subunit [Actinokineospora fastidiosa]GGS28901.1 hypothetical protein GCM10010171_22570 [Actinokineospora fastidiosa]